MTKIVRPWGFWAALAVLGVATSACATRHEFAAAQGGEGGQADAGEPGEPSPHGGRDTHVGGGGSGGAQGGDAQGGGAQGGDSDEGGGGSGPAEADCGDVTCSPHASCVKAGALASCQCAEGYADVNADGSVCEDVDECQEANGGCDPLVTCTNTAGSFSCGDCPEGYSGDAEAGCEDEDECATDHGGCDPLVACTNTGGGYACGTCPFGYTGTGDTTCTDINECSTNNGGCDKGTVCTNKPGAFTCGDCPSGYTGGGATGCVDINECANGNGGCDPLSKCTNSAGGFSCGACPAGYTGTGATGCVDINECATGNGGCHSLSKCTNSAGGFSCGACPAGYTGTGATGCVDINECATSNGGCHALSKCTNSAGGFSCGACPAGYTGTGATGCVDINECATDNGGCDPLSKCTNSAGSSSCGACPAGYTGTGATGCVDINECATDNGGCDPLSKCTNSAGGSSCGACPAGYTGTGAAGCVDVNECATNNGGCSSNATCANSAGSRSCTCKSNYQGDGVSCECKVAPAAPALFAPYRGAYTGSMRAVAARKTLRPTFAFGAVTSQCGSVTYELQLDNSCTPGSLPSCTFASPEVSVQGLLSPTYTPTVDLPVAASAPVGAFYAWRVRACDATKVCSAWSDVASLHVGRVREDLNGDGYGDMVMMTNTTSLVVYYGSAAPDFSTVSAAPAVPTSSDRIGSFIGDVDGDGYGDLGVMQYYAATNGYAPAIVFGGASLTARAPLVLSKSAAGSSLNLALHPAGDFNGDGFDDLLVDFKYFDPKTELQVFYGAAQPANQAALHIPCNFLGYTLSSNTLGDLNRDGFPEIGLAEQGTVGSDWVGRIAIFSGGKTPSTTPVADIARVGGPAALLYAAADLDGDGFGDAVAVETNVGLTLYKGATELSQSVWKTLSNTSTSAGLGGFDMNADGYGDLQLKGATASTYLGGASGPSAATPYPTARGADTFGAASVSDYDGDGLPDLVGSASGGPLWCSSSGTAAPTCFNISNNGTDYTAGSYAFVR